MTLAGGILTDLGWVEGKKENANDADLSDLQTLNFLQLANSKIVFPRKENAKGKSQSS